MSLWLKSDIELELDVLLVHPHSPGEVMSREVELGSQSWMDCLVAEFLNG